MEKSISIRCIKMLAMHTEVLLYKDLDSDGFNLVSREFTHIERNLSFVHLSEVTFDIYEDRREVALQTGKRTVHAVARGTLQFALPQGFNPPKNAVAASKNLKQVDYKPGHEAFFFTTNDNKEIYTAKNLYAFGGIVRVEE
jgi:hypothetical protein